jgi:hypothetical protein
MAGFRARVADKRMQLAFCDGGPRRSRNGGSRSFTACKSGRNRVARAVLRFEFGPSEPMPVFETVNLIFQTRIVPGPRALLFRLAQEATTQILSRNRYLVSFCLPLD